MHSPPSSLCRTPTQFETRVDKGFRWATVAFGTAVLLLLVGILVEIGAQAIPAFREYGLEFLTGTEWDSNTGEYGIRPAIWGTVYSSVLALFAATIVGLSVSLVITQRFLPRWLERILKNVVELLAAIPSVVYGLWGIFVVIPAMRSVLPAFGIAAGEVRDGMAPAALVLAIMVLPTITAVSRDAIVAVPRKLEEAAYGLGATRWECIFRVTLPTAATGIFGAVVLGFGRALGETMALAMLVGNSNTITWSLLSPGNTLAALLANKFPEATDMQVHALMYAAIVLLLITLAVNIVGSLIMQRATRHSRGARA